MRYPILVRTRATNQYEAEPIGIPELKAVGATEEAVLEQVGYALGQWLATAKVVHVEIPLVDQGNPWLDTFGRSAQDPDFDDFMAEVARARTEEQPE